jgi:hypothetical protein
MAKDVRINDVVASVTNDTGAIVVWGDKSDLGKKAEFYKDGGSTPITATFVQYDNKVVAILPQVEPGSYHSIWYGDAKVAADYVSQTTKR